MKSRMILAVLMTLALVTSLVPAGYAGTGGGSSINATLFDCYVIQNGADSPYVLELTDRFGVHKNLTLGRSRMLCTPTSAAVVTSGPALNVFDPGLAFELKCYDRVVQNQNGQGQNGPLGPGAALKIIDPLSTETVTLGQIPMICTPAVTDPPFPQ